MAGNQWLQRDPMEDLHVDCDKWFLEELFEKIYTRSVQKQRGCTQIQEQNAPIHFALIA